jgi:hypothetical protein
MTAPTNWVSSVPFRVFDLTNVKDEGFSPGFYYDIPVFDGEENLNEGEVFLAGPYSSSDDARAAAITFIEETIADHSATDEEVQ